MVLSRHGAGIVSTHKLGAEEGLILRRLDTGKEAPIRLVGQIGSEADRYTYGVELLDSTIDFWGIEFPPPTESEQPARFLVECSVCKKRETVDHSDVELDVYAVSETILRYCKDCQSSTAWKRVSQIESPTDRSEPEKEPERIPVAGDAAPIEPAPPAVEPTPIVTGRPKNRRAHVRTKANCTACVRNPGFEDDIVFCENISRGGLCFKSRKRYYENARIEVAVPYEPGAPAIFLSARVVRVQEMPDGKSFRVGVAYTAATKGKSRTS